MDDRAVTRKQKRIIECWDMHVDMEPDISTERLMAMVSNDMDVEVDVIVAALGAAGMLGEDQT